MLYFLCAFCYNITESGTDTGGTGMKGKGSRCSIRNVVTFAGAFIAWIIGSGFATGQEILQFFTSYGYYSYGVVLLNLLGFLFLGQVLFTTGYAHREEENFNHFTFFCGKNVGRFYSWLIPVTLLMIMAVLISGAGATISEYYGINRYLGSMIMAVMVLCAYLTGFEKMVRIVSTIGPVIIAFTLMVGLTTVIRGAANLSHIRQYETVLGASRSAPNWLISSVLYISLNFLSGSTYFTALGMTARSRKEAKWGAVWGALTMILAIAIMNTAILLHSKDAASLAIPTLYLARHISNVLGAVFSVVLVLGMFSSCSTMMWTVCSRFSFSAPGRNRMAAAAVAVFAFLLGMLPFSRLINVFYPFVGYMGLIYIGCVSCKGLRPLKTYKKGNRDGKISET